MEHPAALILFSHGSLLCGAGEALSAHADRLRADGRFSPVEIGYLNYSEPTFAEAVARCHAAGRRRIVVVPFFLVPGYFVSTALPRQITAAKLSFPDLEFVVAAPLGFEPLLADALVDAANSAVGSEHWRDDLGEAGRYCRPNPECPLYGTPACPKVPAILETA